MPTIGGMLLIGKERETRFSDAWVQCGRFFGVDKSFILDHLDIHDHLPLLVERIIEFVKKHTFRGADLSQIYRRDVWSVPLTIVPEAVVNAIVHADYAQIGSPIRLAFFDDRIEIENPGILQPGMTTEDVYQGISNSATESSEGVSVNLELWNNGAVTFGEW